MMNLLQVAPNKRMTAQQALQHEYFQVSNTQKGNTTFEEMDHNTHEKSGWAKNHRYKPGRKCKLWSYYFLCTNEKDRSLEIDFPHLPLLKQKVVAGFLACEESCGVLVRLLVSTVCVWVRELWIAGFLAVGIVADGQISSCSEGRSKVDWVEDGAVFVHEGHALLKGQRE